MADQKISQLTEKQTLVDDDVLTILDSAASYVNKKAKVGAIPRVANLTDLTVTGTFTGGVLEFTASETFTPVDGDLYKFKAPIGNTSSATAFNLVIGSITYPIYFVISTYALASANLITAGDVLVLVYNSTDSCFYVTYNSTAAAGFQRVGETIVRSAYSILPDGVHDRSLGTASSRWNAVYSIQTFAGGYGLYQSYVTNTATSPSITISSHTITLFTNVLDALTITSIATGTCEAELQFTTGSTFTFTATPLAGKWIGGTPTFEPNKSYTIVIKNGVAACGEIS